METKYMVVRHGTPIPDVVQILIFDLEHYAAQKAVELAVQTQEPHDVYEITLIGTSAAPSSNFVDYRPKPAATT